MRPPPRIRLPRKMTTAAANERRSYGFSGAGFLGCYHVGVSACLRRHGLLPHPNDDDSYSGDKIPLLTGVSAGSMIAASILAGVNPEPDGMEVVMEAARRTRELSRQTKQKEESKSFNFGVSLDVLTPGFSLIDQVEGPFRDAMVKVLGGYCQEDQSGNVTIHDIDPEIFARRFPDNSLRIGLTDRRDLWPPPMPFPVSQRLLNSYRYVDTYRSVEDVLACSMLSSYIPGITGPLNLTDKLPEFLGGLLDSEIMGTNNHTGTIERAGLCLKEMTSFGLVKHGKTGLPIVDNDARSVKDQDTGDNNDKQMEPTYYWDGGIADVFPTIDENTVVVAPVNGLFHPNPSICPRIPDEKFDSANNDERGKDLSLQTQQATTSAESNAFLQQFLRPYLPTTFYHCPKSRLGLNSENANTALKMIFSSDDDELESRFKEGYDDARRYLQDSGQLRVFSG